MYIYIYIYIYINVPYLYDHIFIGKPMTGRILFHATIVFITNLKWSSIEVV